MLFDNTVGRAGFIRAAIGDPDDFFAKFTGEDNLFGLNPGQCPAIDHLPRLDSDRLSTWAREQGFANILADHDAGQPALQLRGFGFDHFFLRRLAALGEQGPLQNLGHDLVRLFARGFATIVANSRKLGGHFGACRRRDDDLGQNDKRKDCA